VQAAGTRIAILDTSGNVLAKDTLSGAWFTETSGTQYAVTPSYLLVRSGSTVNGKAGLNDAWTWVTSVAADVQAAGTRIAIKDTSGNIIAKDTLGGAWYTETSGVNQYIVTPNYLIVRIGSTVYGKAGLNDAWTTLTSVAADVQAAGTRIAIKDTSGN